jgi:hypothetical protein
MGPVQAQLDRPVAALVRVPGLVDVLLGGEDAARAALSGHLAADRGKPRLRRGGALSDPHHVGALFAVHGPAGQAGRHEGAAQRVDGARLARLPRRRAPPAAQPGRPGYRRRGGDRLSRGKGRGAARRRRGLPGHRPATAGRLGAGDRAGAGPILRGRRHGAQRGAAAHAVRCRGPRPGLSGCACGAVRKGRPRTGRVPGAASGRAAGPRVAGPGAGGSQPGHPLHAPAVGGTRPVLCDQQRAHRYDDPPRAARAGAVYALPAVDRRGGGGRPPWPGSTWPGTKASLWCAKSADRIYQLVSDPSSRSNSRVVPVSR